MRKLYRKLARAGAVTIYHSVLTKSSGSRQRADQGLSAGADCQSAAGARESAAPVREKPRPASQRTSESTTSTGNIKHHGTNPRQKNDCDTAGFNTPTPEDVCSNLTHPRPRDSLDVDATD